MTGYEPRFWLQQQDDAGQLIVKMLLSRASSSGLLAVHPLGEVLEPQHPTSTPEECLLTDTFDTFLNSGVYRGNKCIPLATLQQERANLIASGRLPWKDGTETDILTSYQHLLKSFQLKEPSETIQTYEASPSRAVPELRRDILTILKDPRRLDEDKLDAIQALLKTLLPSGHVYLNAEGSFLICGHTLATLKGDLEQNMYAFYRQWTGIDSGQRVCLHCGERIGQVFLQQDEFDDEGHLVVSHGALEKTAFHGASHVDTLTYSLRKLQSAVILIQGFLLTPRKGGLLNLNGFPRDTKDTEKRGIVDTILYTLKSTFEAFPASFRGSVAPFFRSVLTKPKDVRKDAIQNIQRIVEKQFKTLMESAHAQYVEAGITVQSDVAPNIDNQEELEQVFYKPQERPERVPNVSVKCPDIYPRVVLRPSNPPSVSQKQLELKPNIKPGPSAKAIVSEPPDVIQPTSTSESDIRKRIKLGFPNLKLPSLKAYIESSQDGYSLATALHRVLDILSLNSTVPVTLVETTRDTLLKFNIVELELSELYRDTVRGSMKHDIVLRMLLLDKSVAEKEQQELRASERETLKERLRRMDDTRRELTKLYLDMGISAHIVTPEDRELFLQKRQAAPNPEQPDSVDLETTDPSTLRDFTDNGDVPLNDAGVEMGVDYGDYGDRAVRDYDDYANTGDMDDGEGYGT